MAHQRRSSARPTTNWRAPILLVATWITALCLMSACSVTVPAPVTTTVVTRNNPMTVSLTILRGGDRSTLAIAPVYIEGHGPFQFIIDTGASVSLIRRDLAQQLGLRQSGSHQPVNGVGGVEQIVFVDVSSWRAGQLALPSGTIGGGALPLNTGGSSVDGLLGSDVWSQFGKVTLDYDAATLTVYKLLAA